MHYNFPYTRDKQSALAELIVGASPAIDQVVFFNSGSDATAMALRAARAHTGKSACFPAESNWRFVKRAKSFLGPANKQKA